jgi:D-glycero-D-manno-heptose 1,7-bisphosphate phosphatase
MNKAIFLDRDGTINIDYGYVFDPSKLEIIEGVIESLKKLAEAGYLLIVITNQSGIGRGYFDEKQANRFNNYLSIQLKEKGVDITDFFMCVHSPEEFCDCRKPSPLLINAAIAKYNINPNESFMLGDKESDVQAGHNAGVTSMLITTACNIVDCTNKILKNL